MPRKPSKTTRSTNTSLPSRSRQRGSTDLPSLPVTRPSTVTKAAAVPKRPLATTRPIRITDPKPPKPRVTPAKPVSRTPEIEVTSANDPDATSLMLISRETGAAREYEYDADEQLLWVTDRDPDMRAVMKRHFSIEWNPINHIRAKALGDVAA
ncbi:MAG: hypothetical protein JWL76_1982 [Thermoleophilia bacterium]|nr:hypothetical protein [Thermoleophilia bacterium]